MSQVSGVEVDWFPNMNEKNMQQDDGLECFQSVMQVLRDGRGKGTYYFLSPASLTGRFLPDRCNVTRLVAFYCIHESTVNSCLYVVNNFTSACQQSAVQRTNNLSIQSPLKCCLLSYICTLSFTLLFGIRGKRI